MPTAFIPPLLRTLVPAARVQVRAGTVGDIIEELESRYPGVAEKLVEDGDLMAGIAVIINDQVGQMGLMDDVDETAEVHFLPALSGGAT